MEFRIADTFTDSLARLTGDEQKAIKITVFDLQSNPSSPGIKLHRLDNAKDKNFWSARVNNDIRLIIHQTESSMLLCYVDHHDKAYKWAERRRLETHPKTGAAQMVEIRETVKEVIVPKYVEKTEQKPKQMPLFDHVTDEELLGYGVPKDWVKDVRCAFDEDSVLAVAAHLPQEAAEAIVDLATGIKPKPTQVVPAKSAFEHPDAQRRFRVMSSVEELKRALEYPWDKWSIFLHPEQRQFVEKDYSGPAKISGSAGTGKTIVALHRAAFLARANPDARVLLTTFSGILANSLRIKLRRLVDNEPHLAERLEVHAIDDIGARLYSKLRLGTANLAMPDDIADALKNAAEQIKGHKFSQMFLLSEWLHVVDAWQLTTWEAYRDVVRLGRRTKLPEQQRQVLWSIFEHAQKALAVHKLMTSSAMFTQLAESIAKAKQPPFDMVVVDEAQDISVAQLKFMAAIGANRPNALFFAGDIGQRIFQQPFSWVTLGVSIRGRSRTLRVNYRTSHQIRSQADRLLDPEVSDADGNKEKRNETVSVFNGPAPEIRTFASNGEEREFISNWISERLKEGTAPHEIGIFVRSSDELSRAYEAIKRTGKPFRTLDDKVEAISGQIAVSTMHLAKGLEFRAVIVMACDDQVIPSQARISSVGDQGDLKEVYDTERQLLYVACTRARDRLLVTATEPASEFLDDLLSDK